MHGAAVQTPPVQVPPPHDVPHAPQLSGSELVSVQVLLALQYVWPSTGQPHTALWQTRGAPQMEPGHVAPQWFESLDRSTHPIVGQFVCSTPHTHFLSTHASPVGHTVPQPPQLVGSESTFTQMPAVAQ
jgi:hypothetical protein